LIIALIVALIVALIQQHFFSTNSCPDKTLKKCQLEICQAPLLFSRANKQ